MPDNAFSKKLEAFCKKEFENVELMTSFDIPIKIESPAIPIGEAQDFLKESIRVVSKYLLNPVFGGHSANPNRQEIIDQLNSIFDGSSYKNGNIEISYEDVKAKILSILTSKSYVAIIGERGSGKTLLLNKVLNDETKTYLEAIKKTAWFRIDVSKIYNLLKDERSDKEIVNFENYFKVHTAYVFLEYSNLIRNGLSKDHTTSQFFETILNKSIEEDGSGVCGDIASHIDTVSNFYDSMSTQSGNMVNYPSETIIAMMFQPKHSEIMAAFIGIYGCFVQCISNLDFGITAIIDGIDNVSWSKSNADYAKVTDDARQFIKAFSDIVPTKNRTLVLVCRPETLPELKEAYEGYNGGAEQSHKENTIIENWKMVVPCATSVIRKKLDAARNSQAFKVQRSKTLKSLREDENTSESETAEVFEKVLKNYESNSDTILEQFVEQVNLILKPVPEDNLGLFQREIESSSFLEDVFSNNIRALIHGFRRSKEGQRLQEKTGAKGTGKPDRVPEFLLIGGKLYLDSSPRRSDMRRYSEIEMGDVFPNIFWYNPLWAAGTGNKWHGLTGIRILQIFNQTKLRAGDCLYLLHKLFGYSVDILCEQLEAFVAYGLLDMNLQEEPNKPSYCPNDEKYSKLYKYQSFVNVTKKGKIHCSLSFFYVDYLYFCALDTPLHMKFLRDVSGDRFVRFYIEPIFEKNNVNGERGRRYDFNQARIPTTAVFLRHVYYYHKSEMAAISQFNPDNEPELNKIIEKEFSRANSDMNWSEVLNHLFALPDGWLENAIMVLSAAYTRLERSKAREASRELTQTMDDNFGFSE